MSTSIRDSLLPSSATWNMHFLSLSIASKEQWKQKIACVRHLMKTHQILGVVEPHADGETAELAFFSHIENTITYYEDITASKTSDINIAITTHKPWADKHKPVPTIILPDEPGVFFAIRWKVTEYGEDRNAWFIVFRLDAFSEAKRIEQLNKFISWAKVHIGPRDLVLSGGTAISHGKHRKGQAPGRQNGRSPTGWLTPGRTFCERRRAKNCNRAASRGDESSRPSSTWHRRTSSKR